MYSTLVGEQSCQYTGKLQLHTKCTKSRVFNLMNEVFKNIFCFFLTSLMLVNDYHGMAMLCVPTKAVNK